MDPAAVAHFYAKETITYHLGKMVDTRLDENETELGITVFSVDLKMFANSNGLFDEVPEIFGDGWGES